VRANHFTIEELIDKETFESLSEEDAWNLFPDKAIQMIDGIREFVNKPVTINNWKWGGVFQYRGYRPPQSTVGAAHSYHRRGKAFDFDVKDMTASLVRGLLLAHQTDPLLQWIQRIEANVSWVHCDLGVIPEGKNRIYMFNA